MLDHWELIETDLQDRGVDVGDEQLMSTRSWRWLRVRILGLLSAPVAIGVAGPVFSTRLQQALFAGPSADAAETVEN